MKTTIDGNDYVVRFKHTNVDKYYDPTTPAYDRARALRKSGRNGETECSIRRVVREPNVTVAAFGLRVQRNTHEVEIASGTATCGRRDQFSRARGRELSFQRAIMSMVERGSLYLAGALMAKLLPDHKTVSLPGVEARLMIKWSAAGGQMLSAISPEGQLRIAVGKRPVE